MSKTKWTDKIQAIAAIIAILGGIAGFYKLFSTDKEIQSQIDNLTIIAQEFSKQTQIMKEELENSRTRNNLIIEQLSIDKDKWIKQIKPDFSIDMNTWDNWSGTEDLFTIEGLNLVNTGGSAYLLDISINKDNTCDFIIPKTYISHQGRLRFSLIYSAKKPFCIDINLIFKDMEGNIYFQTIKSDKFESNDLFMNEHRNLNFLNVKTFKPIITENNNRP